LAPSQIEADETISAGGCRVETRFGEVDQQIESQLRRIEEDLV
jgi:flagellar assembly protein FliH